jgi:acyl dehydratase
MRYFEDFTPGTVFRLGSRRVDADEIVHFASRFDPQPFHLDEQAAQASPFGGLIASGWHTAAIYMRLYVDAVLADAASEGSPGVEELRWRHPVRPGDVLSGTFTVEDAQPSARNPRRGTVHFRGEAVNQDGVVVLTMRGRGYFSRRHGAG